MDKNKICTECKRVITDDERFTFRASNEGVFYKHVTCPDNEIKIKRRTIPERLRYMAKKLNEPMECNIQAMAMSLEMIADEMDKTEAEEQNDGE